MERQAKDNRKGRELLADFKSHLPKKVRKFPPAEKIFTNLVATVKKTKIAELYSLSKE